MIYDCKKYGLTREDFLKYKDYFFKMLEQFVEIEVKSEDFEEQKNSYINKQFEKRESDILYKIKNKEIYILVEHQSKVDKRMPRRIFEYCMGIMMGLEKTKKDIDGSNPLIIPVVIYTGENKWNVKTSFSETQKTYMMLFEKCKTKEESL